MKYYVSIKIQERPLSSTGFLGEEINSMEELKAAIKKYGIYENNGSRYWGDIVKIHFTAASIIDAIKESGERQCKEYGGVNLFSFISILQKCPYKDVDVFYRHDGWIDDNGIIFRWVVSRGEDHHPVYGKLIDVLKELGIEL